MLSTHPLASEEIVPDKSDFSSYIHSPRVNRWLQRKLPHAAPCIRLPGLDGAAEEVESDGRTIQFIIFSKGLFDIDTKSIFLHQEEICILCINWALHSETYKY